MSLDGHHPTSDGVTGGRNNSTKKTFAAVPFTDSACVPLWGDQDWLERDGRGPAAPTSGDAARLQCSARCSRRSSPPVGACARERGAASSLPTRVVVPGRCITPLSAVRYEVCSFAGNCRAYSTGLRRFLFPPCSRRIRIQRNPIEETLTSLARTGAARAQ